MIDRYIEALYSVISFLEKAKEFYDGSEEVHKYISEGIEAILNAFIEKEMNINE